MLPLGCDLDSDLVAMARPGMQGPDTTLGGKPTVGIEGHGTAGTAPDAAQVRSYVASVLQVPSGRGPALVCILGIVVAKETGSCLATWSCCAQVL
jgi:hypothetical protein